MPTEPIELPTTAPAPVTPATAPDPTPPADDAGKWTPPSSQADLDRIVSERLNRERAKFADYDALAEKAAYWDELEAAGQSEYEQTQAALDAAQSRYEAAQSRIVTAELKAAGVPPELIEDLDLSRFIDADGEVDEARIGVLRDKYAALAPSSPRMAPNPAQGTSAQPPLSLNERIVQAQTAGDTKTVMRLKAAQAVSTSTN